MLSKNASISRFKSVANVAAGNCQNWPMATYKRDRFPPDIISYPVWLYYRFNLSHGDFVDLPAEGDADKILDYFGGSPRTHTKSGFGR